MNIRIGRYALLSLAMIICMVGSGCRDNGERLSASDGAPSAPVNAEPDDFHKKLYIDNAYKFYVSRYDPVFDLTPAINDPGYFTSINWPEKTLAALFRAVMKNDKVLASQLICKDQFGNLARLYSSTDDVMNDPALVKLREIQDARVFLTHKVKIENYILIRFLIKNPENDANIYESEIAMNFSPVSGEYIWHVVDMSEHPLYSNWHFDGDRKVIESVPFKKNAKQPPN